METRRTAPILAIALVVGTSLGVVAQAEGEIGLVSYVEGVRSGTESVEMSEPTVDADGVMHLEDVVIVQTVEWSDPRLPSTMTLRGNTDIYGGPGDPTGAVPFTGSILLEDADGSWTGTQVGYVAYDGTLNATLVLEGQGAYAGHSAILSQSYADAEAMAADIPSWDGILIEGELPPYPPLPQASDG